MLTPKPTSRTVTLLVLIALFVPGCSGHRRAARGTTASATPAVPACPPAPDDTSLEPTERYQILVGGEDEPMALVLDSSAAGDGLLRTPSRPVDLDDPAIGHLAERMLATVLEAGGVGIAAVQVGIPRALLWAQRFDREGEPFELFVNPEVHELATETAEGWEGCLSVSDIYSLVSRSTSISLSYQTLAGEDVVETVEGFTAVILQHEIDHLDGVLFVDRADLADFVDREEYLEIKRQRAEELGTAEDGDEEDGDEEDGDEEDGDEEDEPREGEGPR